MSWDPQVWDDCKDPNKRGFEEDDQRAPRHDVPALRRAREPPHAPAGVSIAQRYVRAEDAAEVAGVAAVPPTGLRVHFMLGDIGRDGKTWKGPHEFRPERFMPGGEAEDVGPLPGPKEIKMMPFGAGRRFCLGMGLGMLHVKLFLAALVREFDWAPPAGETVDLTEWDGFFKTMSKPLRATITRVTM
ncbi:cytochrome P450 89A2 [Setaria viridis]|uniref:cytochrome P450 89A2 n=1 Tax=Setaria viridis TaxID=4556 RepID=UPI001493973C|nr:cytochrome P450 89A2-like [Setaria viridis]